MRSFEQAFTESGNGKYINHMRWCTSQIHPSPHFFTLQTDANNTTPMADWKRQWLNSSIETVGYCLPYPWHPAIFGHSPSHDEKNISSLHPTSPRVPGVPTDLLSPGCSRNQSASWCVALGVVNSTYFILEMDVLLVTSKIWNCLSIDFGWQPLA